MSTRPFLKYLVADFESPAPSAAATRGVSPKATPIAKTMGIMIIETANEVAAKGMVPRNLPTIIESATLTMICPSEPITTG